MILISVGEENHGLFVTFIAMSVILHVSLLTLCIRRKSTKVDIIDI
jgi:hypothetical protein